MQLVAPVDELARVLLEMHAADAHAAAVEIEVAADAHRKVVLADLVALREVRIHVVLAVELGVVRDLALERERGLEARLDRGFVDGRQGAGHAEADLTHVGVGRVAQLTDRAAAEHLRPRARLDMDLHTDHDLPTARQRAPPPPSRRSPPRKRARRAGPRPLATAEP